MKTYKHIFQPIKIGPFIAKNRIEVSPAEPFLCTKDGHITDEFIAFTASFGGLLFLPLNLKSSF